MDSSKSFFILNFSFRCPTKGAFTPVITFINVDLPAPLSPIKATTSPF